MSAQPSSPSPPPGPSSERPPGSPALGAPPDQVQPPSSAAAQPASFRLAAFYANPLVRLALQLLAVCALVLGIIGIFVPGLPTTIFVLVAAWAAARSSPRLHAWLWQHKTFGPTLRNWEEGGLVSRTSKYTATAVMLASVAVMWWSTMPRPVMAFTVAVMAGVCVWLWLRPEPPPGR